MTEQHNQARPSDGTRSRSGCITCRIRKKKCDEQRPVCNACRSRQLACYGFDVPPPAWCTTKTSWEEVRNSDEAKSLRTLAETRYKISRKVGSKVAGSSSTSDPDTSPLLPPAKAKGQPYPPLQLPHGESLGDVRMPPPLFVLARAGGVNTWQLRPETIWWDSKMRNLTPTSSATSSHEETRLLMLFLDVIHPITHTFYELGGSGDRSWMLDRIISNRSLYCSALSISACFDFSLSQPPAINDIGICPRVRNLQSRAIGELRAGIDKFALMKTTPVEDFVWAGAQLLDVVAHLETLEIFSMLQGHWEMHHQAARRIVNHIEICASKTTHASGSKTSVIENTLSTWSTSDPRRRSLEFSLCNFIWIDVLAISTFGAICYIPCSFDYLNLLQSGAIRPQDIMGCEGPIMAIVAKIARLEQWKTMHHGQMHVDGIAAELARQDTQLTDELWHVIAGLERDCGSTDTTRLEEDVRLVSIIWAYGAQVLRQEVTRSTKPEQLDIDQAFVNLCLEKLEALPTRLVMRTSWPYTIAGSMSLSEAQHARFRWVVGRVMQEAQSPGISWKGLMVMEECWRLRRVDPDARVTWREAMESLGARVILT